MYFFKSKRLWYAFIIILPAIQLFSCASLYQGTGINSPYKAGAVHAPLHTKAKQTKASLSTNTSLGSPLPITNIFSGNFGFNAQASTSLTDRIVVIGSANVNQTKQTYPNDEFESHLGRQFEIGGGYFGLNGPKKNTVTEVLGGYGFAHLKCTQANGEIHKFFVQPTFGLIWDGWEISVSNKLSYLSMARSIKPIPPNFIFGDGPPSPSEFIIEPAFTLRAGKKRTKIQFQTQFMLPLSEDNFGVTNRHLQFNLGVQHTFRRK